MLVLSLLLVGICACADNEDPNTDSETQSATEETVDTSEDTSPDDDDDGDDDTPKEPEGTASADPENDGHWTPNY